MEIDERQERERERRLTRKRLLQRAGIAAASVSVGGALAACGEGEQPTAQVATNVDATNLPAPPPTQQPIMCAVTSFFSREEAETVDAIVARLIPGTADDPGAREACVPAYIDHKLASFESFSTPTYFRPPFAKPVKHSTGPQPHAAGAILVDAKELPRYGFQGVHDPAGCIPQGTRDPRQGDEETLRTPLHRAR